MYNAFMRLALVAGLVFLGLAGPASLQGCAPITKAASQVDVRMYGARGDGSTDDTAAIAAAFASAASSRVSVYFPAGTYITTGVTVPSTFSGLVSGPGVIKAKAATAIPSLVNMTGVSNVQWEVDIDQSQTSSTTAADSRCIIGINIDDSRDIDVVGVNVANIRVGNPIYIDGTSSVTPSASHGSQRIRVDRMTCVAYAYNTVDEGAYPVVRSDFYTSDGGGLYYSASNGLKKADYSIDATVSFPATTKDVFFSNSHFENCDRIALLNVDSVHFSNCNLINFYTRGYNASPTCSNVTINGGKITGGTASLIAFAYGSKYCTASGVSVHGSGSVGEQATLKAYFGCEDILFTGITGMATPQKALYVHSSKRIKFQNISLRKNSSGTTVRAIEVSPGESSNTASWQTRDIVFENCSLESSYGISTSQEGSTGSATIAAGGIRVYNCTFDKTLQLFAGVMPTNGEIEFCFNRATRIGSAQDLDSRAFKLFTGNNIQCRMTEQIAASAGSTYQTFPNVYYFTPERDGGGGDGLRNPPVTILQNDIPLVYGVDWFIDGTNAGKMWNQIRMYTPANVVSGDTLTIVRHQ